MATSPVKITREQLKSVVEKDGVRAALIFLNGLTAHRFTALYRFDDETLKNIYFYDRDYPEVESSPEIPVQASYCVFVRSTQRTFAVADASRDERVAAHPKRHELKSYCGVPLLDEQGNMFGSVCHFDFHALPFDQATIELMEALAPILSSRATAWSGNVE